MKKITSLQTIVSYIVTIKKIRERKFMNKLRVLFIKGNGDTDNWVAQCLEYDIAAQGKTIREAKKMFELTMAGELA